MLDISKYVRWDIIAMSTALTIVFALEMLGVFTSNNITITALVRAYLPKWLRAMILGWMCWHFMSN